MAPFNLPYYEAVNGSRSTSSKQGIEAIQGLERLTGLIERVTFFNEENGFSVLKVKVTGRRGLVAVVGNIPAVSAGEWLSAEGRWVQDREHGLQFSATLMRSVPPTTVEGIKRYLGSGLIKGIGPVLAERMVGHFGARIFTIIEEASKALEQIEGIGPTKRERIKKAWEDAKQVREIMVFLHSHGVSTSRAVRIHRTYGARAVEVIRENPYVLARDIHGIGFKSADAIAEQVGIPKDSIMRACAGISHVLFEATGEGHCALPADQLMEASQKLLEIESPTIEQALGTLLANQTLVAENIGGERLVFLPHLRQAERDIAFRLRRLAASRPVFPAIQLELALSWCQQRLGVELSESQLVAVKSALTSRVIIITGGPGVGKTTILRVILGILTAKKVSCLLCAPTGRAAKRLAETTGLEAKTIHRLLEVRPDIGGFARNESRPLECDLLVVDEVSMVDVQLMQSLLRACPPNASLILVGDADQLPSVGPGMVLRDLIDSEVIPTVRLREVYRQATGSRIVQTAHRMLRGQLPDSAQEQTDSDFHFIDREASEQILATIKELLTRRIPARFGLEPARDVQVLCPMNRGSLGVRELNKYLQDLLNPPRHGESAIERFGYQFRPRDKVIQTENDYDKDVFNGDIGRIERIQPVDHLVVVRFEDRLAEYDFDELDELALAYAITIHKSQGSEFPAVIIPLATEQYVLLQRNLIYTGVTRGRKLVVLVGQKKALAIAVRNDRVQKRYSGLLWSLRG